MKSFLLALSMLTLGSVASAQSSGQARGLERSSADTLITLTQDELLRAVRAVAEARLAIESPQRSQTAVGLSASDLHVLKLQLLLNALGLGAVPPAEPSALAPQPAPIAQPGSVNYLSVHPQVATAPAYSSQPSNARLDRLEQLMLLMLQQRNATREALVLPSAPDKRSRGTSRTAPAQLAQPQAHEAPASSSDSLLRVLQQELIALREAQPKQAQQPQVIIQQPAPTVIQQPQQPEVQTKTEVRTDTVVVSYFKRQVFFAVGQSTLLPEARLTLNEVYRVMSADADMKLYLTGYASPEGNAQRNELLSRQRSQAVLDYLVACGISSDRFITVAGGVDRTTDLKGLARRVDIELKK
mgnify:CR=1 FL=1